MTDNSNMNMVVDFQRVAQSEKLTTMGEKLPEKNRHGKENEDRRRLNSTPSKDP